MCGAALVLTVTDRQRRKNEALANEIFGRGRKPKPTSIDNRKFNTKSTFASRVGVAKVRCPVWKLTVDFLNFNIGC
jgi:hypothetical protein